MPVTRTELGKPLAPLEQAQAWLAARFWLKLLGQTQATAAHLNVSLGLRAGTGAEGTQQRDAVPRQCRMPGPCKHGEILLWPAMSSDPQGKNIGAGHALGMALSAWRLPLGSWQPARHDDLAEPVPWLPLPARGPSSMRSGSITASA
jgi:hypothetical protein